MKNKLYIFDMMNINRSNNLYIHSNIMVKVIIQFLFKNNVKFILPEYLAVVECMYYLIIQYDPQKDAYVVMENNNVMFYNPKLINNNKMIVEAINQLVIV